MAQPDTIPGPSGLGPGPSLISDPMSKSSQVSGQGQTRPVYTPTNYDKKNIIRKS